MLTDDKQGTGFAGLGLGLPDLRSTSRKIEPAGGQLLDGPKDIEYGEYMTL